MEQHSSTKRPGSAETATGSVSEARRCKWFIRGMDCGSCAAKVEKALSALPGVEQVRVVYSTERLLVDMEPSVSVEVIESKISELGFSLESGQQAEAEPGFWQLHRELLTLGVLSLLALIVRLVQPEWGELAFYLPAAVGVIPFIRKSIAQAKKW